MAVITLDLPDDLLAAAQAAVAAGHAASIEAFVVTALRASEADQWDFAALRAAMAEGDASGPAIPAQDVFDSVMAELRDRAPRG